MGRKVSNTYLNDSGVGLLRIYSHDLYSVEAIVDPKHFDELHKYSWCYEQGKGLVYMMDLTMQLPRKLGFKTPRVYLRDFILYLEGYTNVLWDRKALHDYRVIPEAVRPICSRLDIQTPHGATT